MKKMLIFAMLFAFASLIFAQVALSEYSMTYSAGTYTEISGGISLGNTSTDDQRFVDPAVPLGGTTNTGVGFPIGFDFTYAGVVFDRVGINANGWISLGQSALTPSVNTVHLTSYNPINATTSVTPAILASRLSPVGRDLQAQTGATLRIETVGTAPNREFVVQWKNYRKYAANGDSYNFQIRLQENGDKVVFVYGTMTNNANSTTVQVGLRGEPATTATNWKNLTSTTSWTSPAAGASNSASMTLSNTVFPASGTTYTWAPPVAGLPPNPAIVVSPVNNATGILPTATLNWASGGGLPTGYKLNFGTDYPPTNMESDNDLGNVTTFNPGGLSMNTDYYWQVIPYNTNGNAEECPVWTFKTHTGQVSLTAPAADAINQSITNLNFSWGTAPGASSYRLQIGTSSGSGDVFSGAATSPYTLLGPLNYSTNYFWSVFSVYPDGRIEYQSAERTFTTMADPTIRTFPWIADFNTTPFPPLNWSQGVGELAEPTTITSGSMWAHHNFGNTGGSNNAAYINVYGEKKHWLFTPSIDLDTRTNYQLEFDIALTPWTGTTQSTLGDNDYIAVVISTDNGITWSQSNVLIDWNASSTISPTGDHYIVDLSSYTGIVKLGFYAQRIPSANTPDLRFYVDNVQVREIPETPEFSYSPSTMAFSFTQSGTISTAQNVTVSNTGQGNLILTADEVRIEGTDAADFSFDAANLPADLTTGQSVVIPVSFTPQSAGDKTATLFITYASVDYEVALTGYAYPDNYVFEGFDSSTFPPVGWANPGTWSRSTTTVFAGTGSAYKYGTSSSPYILSTPKLDIANGDHLMFMGRVSSTSATLDIIYSQNRSDWTVLQTLTSPTANTWLQVDVELSPILDSKASEGYYLGFRANSTYVSYYIDNVVMPPIVLEAPEAVTLSSPANAATNQSIKPTLSWTPAATGGVPTSYDIYLEANDDLGADPSVLLANVPASPYTLTGNLNFGTTYIWKVVAKNAIGDSPDSAIHSFSTISGKATITSPSNNNQTVAISSRKLDWANVTNATGYKITVGTTEGGTDIANMVECADSEWTKDSNWEYNTNYYWRVFTLNGEQEVPGDLWNFKTMEDPTLTPPFIEVFATVPPLNWQRYAGIMTDPIALTTTTSGWIADGFANVGTTGSARLNIFGTGCRYWLVSPPINLGDAKSGYELIFDLALTAYNNTTPPALTGTDDKFAVVISTDNGETWSTSNILRLWDNDSSSYVYNEISNTGEQVRIDLEGYSGLVRIGFYGESTVSNADNDLFVDNFEIREVTDVPAFSIDPVSWDYSQVLLGNAVPKVFTIRNAGGGTLEIAKEDITITGDNAAEFVLSPVTEDIILEAGQTAQITVTFTPGSEGAKEATLQIIDNIEETKSGVKATRNVPLDGEGFDATISSFPWTESFEAATFPPTGWTTADLDGGGAFWESSTSFNHTVAGSRSAKHGFSSAIPIPGQNGWLITPLIVLPAATNMAISFWNYNQYPNDLVYNGVLVNTTADPNDPNWEEIWAADTATANWTNEIVSITGYAGQTIYLAFVYQGYNADSWFVDDIEIYQSFDYPADQPITIGEDDDAITITVSGGSANNVPGGEIPAVNNAAFVAVGSFVLELIGSGPWTITIETDAPWGAYYRSGNWTAVENDGGTITFIVEASKDLTMPIILGDVDPTLPVTLASFTAVLTSDLHVKIAWMAESEVDHAGYNLLRSEVNELSTALRLNAGLIDEGTANGTQMSYLYTDTEVYHNALYYYWLESVSLTGESEYFGPIMVLINANGEEPGIPAIPIETKLFSAFPNPFNPSTNLRYSMKEAGDVRIDVYNVKGQILKTFEKHHSLPGYYQVNWDGRDMNGRVVGTGVYFYRMSSGKYSATKKMVLAK